jgi:hypothetical protein
MIQRFKDSGANGGDYPVQTGFVRNGYEDSKIQSFKDSKIQPFNHSKIQLFKDSGANDGDYPVQTGFARAKTVR